MKKNTRTLRQALVALAAIAFIGFGFAACDNPTGSSNGGTVYRTVTFDTGGGTPVPAPQRVADGGHAARPGSDPRRGDDVFIGWYTEAAGGQPFHFEGTPVTGNITIHARWFAEGEDRFLVSFDTHGGSPVSAQIVDDGEFATEPYPEPTKAGHEFNGWYTEEQGGTAFNFETTAITASRTIHARWVQIHTVTFLTYGDAMFATQPVLHGGYAIEPYPAPTREGHNFTGWYTGATAGTAFNFETTPVTEDITLHARWATAITHTVTFLTYDGSVFATQPVPHGGYATAPDPAPTRYGHTFTGWYTGATTGTAINFENTVFTANITLHARWAPIIRTVTFLTYNDAVFATQPVPHGGNATAPEAAPTQAGHDFTGWYTEEQPGTAFNFETTPIIADITLYARWATAITRTVTFLTYDSSVFATQPVPHGVTAAEPYPAPTQAGYRFTRWYTGSNTPFVFTTPITEDITLHAGWIALRRVTFMDGDAVFIMQDVPHGGNAAAPYPAPTRANFALAGWFTDAALTQEFSFYVTVNDPVTLYAGWDRQWRYVAAGSTHTVAIAEDGTLWAWGNNHGGRLGDGTQDNRHAPVQVYGSHTDWVAVAAGRSHTVGIRQESPTRRTLWAWGGGWLGVDDDNTWASFIPVQVHGNHGDWVAVAAGRDHTVGIRQESPTRRTLWAWGSNQHGRLGIGEDQWERWESRIPVQVYGNHTDWAAVAAGEQHTVGIRQDGENRTLWAWGWNGDDVWVGGWLGDGTTTQSNIPVQVYGSHTDWAAVAAGFQHTVGIRRNGENRTLWAWGWNGDFGGDGRLGNLTWGMHLTPVQVQSSRGVMFTYTDWVAVAAGHSHTVGIRQDGENRTLWAWGNNGQEGRLGINVWGGVRWAPVQVHGNHTDWVAVAAGEWHTVGIRQDAAGNRSLWAWGADGITQFHRFTPVQVRALTR